MSHSRAHDLNYYSFDDVSNPPFEMPISPIISGTDMFFHDNVQPTHINPAAMWNGSEKADLSDRVDMAASQNAPGLAKILTDYEGPADRHFGQITPPSDHDNNSPGKLAGKQRADSGIDQEMNMDYTAIASPRSSSKSQQSSKSGATLSGGRPSKRAKKESQVEEDDEDDNLLEGLEGLDGGRRNKYREKNRVAAAKCRAKKKEHTDHLEDTHRTQSVLNTALRQTEKSLRDELSYWRTQALQHTFCQCRPIQEYNMRKAQNLAAESVLGNATCMRSPSLTSSSSMSPPMPKKCDVQSSRSHSLSGAGLASPLTPSSTMNARRNSIAASPSFTAFQSTGHGRHTSDSMLRNRPMSNAAEQELKDFVNDVVD